MKPIFVVLLVHTLVLTNAQTRCGFINKKSCGPNDESDKCSTKKVCKGADKGAGKEKCGNEVCEFPFVCSDPSSTECNKLVAPPGCEVKDSPGFCVPRQEPCGDHTVCKGADSCKSSVVCDKPSGKRNPLAGTDSTKVDLPNGCKREYFCVNDGSVGERSCGPTTCAADEMCVIPPLCAEYLERLGRCYSSTRGCIRLLDEVEENLVTPCESVKVCDDSGVDCDGTVCNVGEVCNTKQVWSCDTPSGGTDGPVIKRPTQETPKSNSSTSDFSVVSRKNRVDAVVRSITDGEGESGTKLKVETRGNVIDAETKSSVDELFGTITSNFTKNYDHSDYGHVEAISKSGKKKSRKKWILRRRAGRV